MWRILKWSKILARYIRKSWKPQKIVVPIVGVILNPPTTDHLLNDRPTNRSPTHRPNTHRPNRQDSISKTWSMKNIYFTEHIHSWEDVKLYFGLLSIWWINNFIKSLFIFTKYLLFYKRHTEDLTMFMFLDFKLNCCTPSQIYHSFFLRKEISIKPDFFYIALFCMWYSNQQIKV